MHNALMNLKSVGAARRLAAAMLVLGALLWIAPGYAQAPVGTASAPAAPAAAGTATTGDRNVYSAGGQVRPAGPIAGDFAAAGGRVIVDQPVGGDASLIGGSVDLRAPVGDDVRAVGGDINIESTVGGELFASGGHITVTRAASVARAARIYGANVTLDGRFDGPLEASAQSIVINGQVRGDVRLMAERIELGPTARIDGSLHYTSKSELARAEGAAIAGAVTREDSAGAQPHTPGERGATPAPRRDDTDWGEGLFWAGSFMGLLAMLACAAVLLAVAPGFARQTAARIKSSPWLALAIGFAAVVAVPVLAVLLFVTILGIPLGVIVLALYPALLLVGFVVGALFIARLIPAALRKPPPTTFGASLGYAALALLAILLLGRLPVLGGVVIAGVSLLGIGACVLELYGRRQRPGLPPPATA